MLLGIVDQLVAIIRRNAAGHAEIAFAASGAGDAEVTQAPGTAAIQFAASGALAVSAAAAGSAAIAFDASGIPPSPLSIAGCVCWLDFTDAAKVTLDGSNNISQVTDKSVAGNHATQTTAGSRPGWSAQTPNSAYGGVFNGAPFMRTSIALSQPYTLVVVGKNSSTAGYFIDGPSSHRVGMLYAGSSALSGGGNYLWGWANTTPALGDTTTSDLNKDLIAVFIGDGTSSKMFINGAQRGSTASAGTATMTTQTIGSGVGALNGYIAHLLVYNVALSSGDRIELENWLKVDTGISW